MGGYGAFVWPSYGLAALVLVALLIVSLRERRRNQVRLERLRALRRGGFQATGSEEGDAAAPVDADISQGRTQS